MIGPLENISDDSQLKVFGKAPLTEADLVAMRTRLTRPREDTQ